MDWAAGDCCGWSTPAGEEDLAALERARQETGCRKKASLYRCPKAGSPCCWALPTR